MNYEHTGVGCVIRVARGCFLRARSNMVRGNMQARETEALSLKEAITWTKTWRARKCIFEMDAKLVVDAIHRGMRNYIFHYIFEQCVELLKHFEEVILTFDYKCTNKINHVLPQTVTAPTLFVISFLKKFNICKFEFLNKKVNYIF